MITLALDTSTRAGSVALRRDGVLIRAHVGAADVPHGRRLPGDLLDLLAACGVSLPEVTLYAVAIGPGAFTGLRSASRRCRASRSRTAGPLAGVSALEACAYAVPDDAAAAGTPLVAAWMDAARGRGVHRALCPSTPRSRPDARRRTGGRSPQATLARWAALVTPIGVLFAGDGAMRYEDMIRAAFASRGVVVPRVPALANTIGERAEAAAAAGARRTAACGASALRPPAGCRARA